MTGERPPAWSLQDRQPGQSALDMVKALRTAGSPEAEVRPWEIGLHGERMAARIFARLGDEWTVLHDVPVGTQGANIDHVLISAAGVFTINTKHHPKANITISGPDVLIRDQPQPYVEKALYEGKRVSRLLSDCTGKHIPVQPILLFVGGATVTVHRSPMGVLVSDSDSILGMLDSFSYSLTHATLDAVLAAAVHPETWAQSINFTPPTRHHAPTTQRSRPVRTYPSNADWLRTADWPRTIDRSRVPQRQHKTKKPSSCMSVIGFIVGVLMLVGAINILQQVVEPQDLPAEHGVDTSLQHKPTERPSPNTARGRR